MTPESRSLGCIVLAAGSSRRFGSDKRISRLPDGRRLLDATLQSIPPVFERSIVVLHPGDEALAATLPARWRAVQAPDAERGMGHSLAAGVTALQGVDAALVVLGDMPHVRESTYRALLEALRADNIVVPRAGGRRGNPVGFGAVFLARLEALRGEVGARDLLREQASALYWVDVEDEGIFRDVDHPAQLLAP